MISYIKGELTEISEGIIVVENNGIGFNINVPATVISSLSSIGEEVKVYTYLQIREDAHSLYGFLTRDDLNMFKMLINVNGIGPKGALAILSTISPDDLRFAICSGDVKLISSTPGIGNKIAQKIILELKDKINLTDVLERSEGSSIENASGSELNAKNEAVEALVNLGYSNSEAVRAVRQIDDADKKDSETILKEALKKLAII